MALRIQDRRVRRKREVIGVVFRVLDVHFLLDDVAFVVQARLEIKPPRRAGFELAVRDIAPDDAVSRRVLNIIPTEPAGRRDPGAAENDDLIVAGRAVDKLNAVRVVQRSQLLNRYLVVVRRPNDLFDREQLIRPAVAVVLDNEDMIFLIFTALGFRIDDDGARRVLIIGRVETIAAACCRDIAAVKQIIARAALERVVARAAAQNVVASPAVEPIVPALAPNDVVA